MPSASTSKQHISDNSTQTQNYGSKRRQSSAGSASKKGLVYEAMGIFRSYLDRCRRPCRRATPEKYAQTSPLVFARLRVHGCHSTFVESGAARSGARGSIQRN